VSAERRAEYWHAEHAAANVEIARLERELAAARLALAGIQETYSAVLSPEAHRMIDAAMAKAKEPT
jgi:hypothetical protein